MVRSDRWAGMFGVVRLFSPPVPPRFFFLASASSFAQHQALWGYFSPVEGFLFTLYLLNFFTCFIHRTVFCRWDYDVFILHTTRRPVPLHCPAPFSYPASPGERPRAQPIVAAGFEPACRYHSGGAGGASRSPCTERPRAERPSAEHARTECARAGR